MNLIAIEEHWTTPRLTAALKDLPEGERDESLAFNEMGDNLALLEDVGDARIAVMDEQGIDLSVLSVAPPATGPLAAAGALTLSRELNDLAAEAVSRHPSRLRAMATLPMAEPSAVAGELERAAGLGLVGAMVYGRTGDTPLDHPCYDDLFATAAALRLPVFIHPQIPTRAVREAAYSGFDDLTSLALSTFTWGWHLEAGLAALRLIARGTLDAHPDLQIVLGHWGELLPFWSERTDSLHRIAKLERKPSEYIRSNVHITCSGMLSPALLRHARDVTTPDRLLFSTDHPFLRPTSGEIQRFLTEIEDDAERAAFAAGNACRLFGIELPGTPDRAA
ncbi:amidohydrolase family protein [Kineosporia sp. J2-2]|uniref:Amidohydrolase family protein n=1 Tax=Kineosporia corallincola TaxID=2835133 RepID=A0ABS5TAT8_9ACTN|nr:amidohydrolase family protein [Kineosporia corallincola]MBT0768184.1 amidohydrolase family protein [Kineosporia corallincola]